MGSSDIISKVGDFLKALSQGIKEGVLFLGSPRDLIFSALDIIVLTCIFYFILKILRDSRAWQLLKGIVLIFLLGLTSNALGFTALGFLLNNAISVFAIAFVVIFQPELRRALETVGRSGFHVFSSDDLVYEGKTQRVIESIVQACAEMSKKRTGALIVIERSTSLGDLEEQENAVLVDAAVSATFLKQIFYLGSPLHDGAILVRSGRVAAARVHIPLSDNYHLRHDLGTRHRAAIGASEIGDAIAVVVSEERGTISIGIEGRLYPLDNEDALRTQLHRLLIPDEDKKRKRISFKHMRQDILPGAPPQSRKRKSALLLASLCLALFFWTFVQISENPVQTQSYQIPLVYENTDLLEQRSLLVQYRMETIRVTISGRKLTLDSLNPRELTAYVDMDAVKYKGIQNLPVQIRTGSSKYTRTDSLVPASVTISVRPIETEAFSSAGD